MLTGQWKEIEALQVGLHISKLSLQTVQKVGIVEKIPKRTR